MRPAFSPRTLFLFCRHAGARISAAQQAKKLGVHPRHFRRMLGVAWERWRVGQAEKWCDICGVSFWALDFTPDLLRRVKWTSGEPAVIDALKEFHRHGYPGELCTKVNLMLDAKAIEGELGRRRIQADEL